ncbi:MAG: histidinol-phosphate transaminase [Byssovorax sp.]
MSERPLASLLRPELAELSSYEPHQGSFDVRLDANESPALLSPEAEAELGRALIPPAYNRYPDARATALRAAIARASDCSPDEVLVGTGSDEVIALLLTALDRPRDRTTPPTIVTASPTFVMYRLSARARGFRVVEVPLDARWDLDMGSMKKALDFARPNLIFVATPNNPTSNLVSRDRLEALIEAAPDSLVIVDEAYVDFAPRTQIDLRRKYPNVAVMRTLSKVGFAALRIGWVIGPAELIREVDKTRQPYNLPVPSQRGATFVIDSLGDEVKRMCAAIISERVRLTEGLDKLGVSVTPSDANFLWVETKRPAGEVFDALAARGVLVKSFHTRGGRLAHRLRITVGLPEENDRLLHEIERCV